MDSVLNLQQRFNSHLMSHADKTLEKIRAFKSHLEENNSFLYGGEHSPIVPIPFILSEEEARKLAGLSSQLVEIILSIPKRIFGNDLKLYAKALKVPENRFELYSQTFGDDVSYACRGDALLTSDGWKFVELNVSGILGGIDIGSANKANEHLEFFEGFDSASDFAYLDPIESLKEKLRRSARKLKPTGRATVAIIEWSQWMPDLKDHYYCLKNLLQDPAYEVVVCDEKEISIAEDFLSKDGQVIDIVLRSFQSFDSLPDIQLMTELMVLHKKRKIECYVPSHAELFMSKMNFSILWDPKNQDLFSDAEKEFIREYIPETFAIDNMTVVLREKDNFIIKASASWGGDGVYAGWEHEEEEWTELLSTLPESSAFIAQKRVQVVEFPLPFAVNDELKIEGQNVVWGPIIIDTQYAGMFTRALPINKGSIVNGSRGAALGSVFTMS